jgi:protein ImuA
MSPTPHPSNQKQLLDVLAQRIRRMERSHPENLARKGLSFKALPEKTSTEKPQAEERHSKEKHLEKGQGNEVIAAVGRVIGAVGRGGWTDFSLCTSSLRTTGIPALDELLADRGLPAGSLMEWLEPGMGSGADTLALWAAVRARRPNELLIVIDSRGDFYPLGAAALGLDVSTTVVIRPRDPSESLWTLEQSLRTAGVGVVVCPWRHLSPQVFRRLQLAAEKGGSLGVLLRPMRARGDPSFAEVRWAVQSLPCRENGARRWRVELGRARRQMTGGSVELELRDDDGGLHLVPAVVAATPLVEAS